MRTLIAVMLSTDAQAYEAVRALERLDNDGTIMLDGTLVVHRETGGAVTTKFTSHDPMRQMRVGSVLGAVLGVLGGPVGILVGATAGGFAGAVGGAVRATISNEYVESIGEHLVPGAFAVLAELDERSPGPIDARMAELEGKVLRETRTEFFRDMRRLSRP